ncbi:LacI family DNA-binding transcriptional regulator [Paenibacillus donghaensis]|uniref:LacI family DNA-binding transcriptional regulator n=1 Tax=Paenibacillus donghaensis TaxID=414771 RepID=UPI001471D05E|nr:LacI family DNA-binding transcriptional regulator [Paenibacillus donghaensis]
MASRDKRVTLQDVANDAGVSRATASLVVRGSKSIKASTHKKVMDSMEKLGYVYDRLAASFRSQSSSTVGIVITDIENPFYHQMLTKISDVLYEQQFTFLLGMSSESQEKQEKVLETMLENRVCGIILTPVAGTPPLLFNKLRSMQIPALLIGREVEGSGADYVGTDYRLGSQLAIRHLVEQGHRRIAYIGGMPPGNTAYRERIDGYCSALRECGLEVDPQLIIPTPLNREGGIRAIQEALLLDHPPTACFCHNDIIALGVTIGMRFQGLVPGEHMAIVGFDNVLETETVEPQLTTVSVFHDQWGVESARQMLGRIGGLLNDPVKIIIPPKLIVRKSSVCFKGLPNLKA